MADLSDPNAADQPIVCTISPDEKREAAALYQALFTSAYTGRERLPDGVLWRFRSDEGVEARVHRLAAIEQRCCAFLRIAVMAGEGEVKWELRGPEAARTFLDEYYRLPEKKPGELAADISIR